MTGWEGKKVPDTGKESAKWSTPEIPRPVSPTFQFTRRTPEHAKSKQRVSRPETDKYPTALKEGSA